MLIYSVFITETKSVYSGWGPWDTAILILHMKTLRLREAKQSTQGHTA